MDKEFSWGWVIFIILILWFFVGGTGLNGRNVNADAVAGGCNRVSNCELERETLNNFYQTNLNVVNQGSLTRAELNAQANITNTKIDFYAYEAQKEKVADLKSENMYLRGQIADNAQFCNINSRLSQMECEMLKAPRLSGLAVACPSSAIYNGCGGCGYNGLV